MTTPTVNGSDLRTVADAVAGQAAATPEALALAAGERRLTYGDLEAQAEWLANMVPAEFAVLPFLPIDASGKVDRAALPPPGEAEFLRDDRHVTA